MMKKKDYFSEKRFITISETAEQFFCGRVTKAALYQLAREGKLPAIKVGRRVLIDAQKLEDMYA